MFLFKPTDRSCAPCNARCKRFCIPFIGQAKVDFVPFSHDRFDKEWYCFDKPGIMCFSLESKVFVKDKGSTFIQDLVVGDMVLSDEKGTYTKFYSKGHFDDEKNTNFCVSTLNSMASLWSSLLATWSILLRVCCPFPPNQSRLGTVLKTFDGPSKVISVRTISPKGLANDPLMLLMALHLPSTAKSLDLEAMMLAGSILPV
jgi:hypothetical protein